jgi:hypothetical protein
MHMIEGGTSDKSERESSGGSSEAKDVSPAPSTENSIENVNPWLIAQEALRRVVDEHSYVNWFSQTRFESYSEGVLTVQTPSQFFANWLTEHYLDTVNKTLSPILSDLKTVRFTAAPEPVRDGREVTPLPQRVRSESAS